MKIKHLSFGSLAFGEVLFPSFIPKERTEINLPHMLILVEEMIINSSSRLLLYDYRVPHSLSFGASLFLANTEYLKGIALLVKPGLNERIANILKLKSIAFPIELFRTKEEAFSWLNHLKEIQLIQKKIPDNFKIGLEDSSAKNVG